MVKKAKAKNLVPFRLPGSVEEEEERMIREVDSSLKDDERVLVRHYLRLAGMLLNNADAQERRGAPSAPKKERPQAKETRPDRKKAA
jgi:hypothetical protein